MSKPLPSSKSSQAPDRSKSAALTERSSFQAPKAQASPPEAQLSAPVQRLGGLFREWRPMLGLFGTVFCTFQLSNSVSDMPGALVNAGLVFGTGWLFSTRIRRFGIRFWLAPVVAFFGFNLYTLVMSAVLFWGTGAYHLLMLFGSVTALLFYFLVTLLLPKSKVPIVPSRTDLTIALCWEEVVRLVEQDKTDEPEFLAWLDVLERYERSQAIHSQKYPS